MKLVISDWPITKQIEKRFCKISEIEVSPVPFCEFTRHNTKLRMRERQLGALTNYLDHLYILHVIFFVLMNLLVSLYGRVIA